MTGKIDWLPDRAKIRFSPALMATVAHGYTDEGERLVWLLALAPELLNLVKQAIDLPESGGAHWLNQARKVVALIENHHE